MFRLFISLHENYFCIKFVLGENAPKCISILFKPKISPIYYIHFSKLNDALEKKTNKQKKMTSANKKTTFCDLKNFNNKKIVTQSKHHIEMSGHGKLFEVLMTTKLSPKSIRWIIFISATSIWHVSPISKCFFLSVFVILKFIVLNRIRKTHNTNKKSGDLFDWNTHAHELIEQQLVRMSTQLKKLFFFFVSQEISMVWIWCFFGRFYKIGTNCSTYEHLQTAKKTHTERLEKQSMAISVTMSPFIVVRCPSKGIDFDSFQCDP